MTPANTAMPSLRQREPTCEGMCAEEGAERVDERSLLTPKRVRQGVAKQDDSRPKAQGPRPKLGRAEVLPKRLPDKGFLGLWPWAVGLILTIYCSYFYTMKD